MIAIVDYGMGNLRSVQKALERVGATAVVTDEPGALDAAQGIVLPGVGAFGDAMANLRARRLIEPVLRQASRGKPLLGICLGMQLLFDESEEMGRHRGLGLLPGRVVRFPEGKLKVPHVGWNQLQIADCKLQIAEDWYLVNKVGRGERRRALQRPKPVDRQRNRCLETPPTLARPNILRRYEDWLLAGIADGAYAYFVHSYYVAPAEPADALATTEYGIEFVSVVGRGTIWGAQFHPEKSQEVGLQLLKNFSQAVNEGGIGNDCVSGD